MKRKIAIVLLIGLMIAAPAVLFAGGQKDEGGKAEGKGEKIKIAYYWTLYEGVTEEYRLALETAFNESQDEIELEIVPVDWEQQHDKLTTALASGKPPAAATVPTGSAESSRSGH